MAKQLTDKNFYPGGYTDDSMSVNTIADLKTLTRSRKFVGLTVTVLNAITNSENEPIPADFWLSETRNTWVLKNLAPIDTLDVISNIPEEYIPVGFEITLKNGEKYHYTLSDDEKPIWVLSIKNEEIKDLISDTVQDAINKVTSGASDAFDTLKEIEDWIKENSGSTGSPGVDGITPKFKIENDYWFVSYDEGETWENLGKATGEKGDTGETGSQGEKGDKGDQGEQGIQGEKGEDGNDGKSAYQIWLDAGNEGSEIDFLASLKGEQGIQGEKGALDEEQIASLKDEIKSYTDESLEGYATETFVKNAIAHAQLSGGTDNVLYTNGEGISIDETNKISVKIAKDTVEKENFIEINENNELELNEITLDAAVISEDIEVNGGAWADEVETVFDGKIPAGITFEDFLKRMVKKEKYAREISTIRNFEVILSGNAPTLTSNGVDVNEKIVEIGTQVKFSQVVPFSTIATQSISAGTFTYGYKIGENGEYNNSQLYSLELKPELVESASTVQVTFTKLSQDLNGTIPVENIYVTDGNNVNEVIAYVNEGYNSITLCQTGDTYSSNSNIDKKDIYVATSLKNYTTEDGDVNIYELTFPVTSATASNKITYHVTGAKKYYIGGINEYSKDYWAKGNPSDIIRNLELQNWASGSTIETSYTFKEGTKQQTVVVPSEYTKVIGTDRIGGPVNFEKVAENINFYNQQGYYCKYNVFVAPAYDGLSTKSFINITIEK